MNFCRGNITRLGFSKWKQRWPHVKSTANTHSTSYKYIPDPHKTTALLEICKLDASRSKIQAGGISKRSTTAQEFCLCQHYSKGCKAYTINIWMRRNTKAEWFICSRSPFGLEMGEARLWGWLGRTQAELYEPSACVGGKMEPSGCHWGRPEQAFGDNSDERCCHGVQVSGLHTSKYGSGGGGHSVCQRGQMGWQETKWRWAKDARPEAFPWANETHGKRESRGEQESLLAG